MRKTTEQFIKEATELHNGKYDYSKTVYVNNCTAVTVICPIHGEFQQRPDNHLHSYGCPFCNKESAKRKNSKTTESFIEEAKEAYPDYDYSKVVYKNKKTPVIIICHEHGAFKMLPGRFLKYGCPKCNKKPLIIKEANNKAKTTEQFIEEAKKLFPNYDYSKVKYINAKTKVEIVCPKHGSFWKTPSMLLFKKQGCPECSREKRASNTEEFISKAKKIFPNYDYSKVNYYNKRTKVEVVCPKHGSFYIKPNDLLNNHGCPKCTRSKGNEFIDKFFTDKNIEHIMEFIDENCKYKKPLPFDCYVPEFNLLIEYQGKQHYEEVWDHESLKERKVKDDIKKEFAKNNGYNFLEISYKDDIEEILTKFLKSYIIIE